MAEENRGTGGQASAGPEAEPRPYELKQVQVRLRLSEAGSIYSTKEISNPVRAPRSCRMSSPRWIGNMFVS